MTLRQRALRAFKTYFTDALPRGFRARWYYLPILLAAVALDQLTKRIVVSTMVLGSSVTVIPHVFSFTFITNDGAAWGMLDDHRWVFMVLSVVGILAFAAYLFGKRESAPFMDTALSLIIGGGVGNMIDRVLSGEVVDFLDATFMDVFGGFPIFNVADCFVCIGAVMLLVSLIVEMVREGRASRTQRTEAERNDAEEPPRDGRGTP